MYYVVFQKNDRKRYFAAFSDKQQFEEDYSAEHGDVIAQGITKEKASILCSTSK